MCTLCMGITMVVCDSLLYFYAIMKLALADLVDHHTDILCVLLEDFSI